MTSEDHPDPPNIAEMWEKHAEHSEKNAEFFREMVDRGVLGYPPPLTPNEKLSLWGMFIAGFGVGGIIAALIILSLS